MPSPQPFSLHVPEADIADLHVRLAKTRFPDQAPDAPWAYGTDLGYQRTLVEHWRTRFDWRAGGHRKFDRPAGSMLVLSCRASDDPFSAVVAVDPRTRRPRLPY